MAIISNETSTGEYVVGICARFVEEFCLSCVSFGLDSDEQKTCQPFEMRIDGVTKGPLCMPEQT